MGLAEEYQLSLYQDYGPLEDKKNVHLVRNQNTGEICIKKRMDRGQKQIVEFLYHNPGPYFPKVFLYVEEEDGLTVVEEYVEGSPLSGVIPEQGMPEKTALLIAAQVCRALEFLHQASPMIVYRDLKAENIVLDREGNIKLVDFDISRIYSEGKNRDTRLLGTAEYAAPEQFGYFQTDNRTDIYAFGVLLNVMLTGRFPVEVAAPEPYASVIRRCTELEPSRRYQQIEEVLRALKKQDGKAEEEPAGESENRKRHGRDEKWKTYLPPGFRSGQVWKMLTALAGYLFIILVCAEMDFKHSDGMPYPVGIQRLNQIGVGLAQTAVIFLVCNYRGISDRIPFLNSKNQWVRAAAAVAAEVLIMLLCIVLLAVLDAILGIG